MKKQLIVLSALFVVISSQCSYFDRMKAAAQSKLSAAKSTLSGMKESAQTTLQSAKDKFQEARSNIRGAAELSQANLASIKERIRNAGEDFVDYYIDPIKGKMRVMYNRINPQLSKVVVEDLNTGITEERYYNPQTDTIPRI